MNNLLAADHAELDALLKEIFAELESGDAGRVYQSLDFFWARLAMHIRAEHLHLFPALLRAFDSPQVEEKRGLSLKIIKSKIAQLKSDHDFFMRKLSAAIKQIRELQGINQSDNSPPLSSVREKIFAVRRRLELHNEIEESEVYRWAETLFDAAERVDLNERMRKELENLPPRFDKSKDE